MLRGWLGTKKTHGGPATSLDALDESAQIQDAMAAVSLIMSDDVAAAEEELNKSNSPFHQLGKGVVTFMRATLGFEQETMREASDVLTNAENSAYEQQRRAVANMSTYQSPIFPPGTEYAVCLAEARLMSAIVGVLNESLTEAIKSFYKLRKAYLVLQEVLDAETKYVKARSTESSEPASKGSSRPMSVKSVIGGISHTEIGTPAAASSKHSPADTEDEDIEFEDAKEVRTGVSTPLNYLGHLDASSVKGAPPVSGYVSNTLQGKSSTELGSPSSTKLDASTSEVMAQMEGLSLTDTVKDGADITVFGTHPVDLFIISGANFCFGVLLLVISLVPPAFNTLLKIVGFKGDRERGIQMLWQATKFDNFHGAMAGLILFGFYNGMMGFCDIVPRTGQGSYPKARCKQLLAEMRIRHPKSHLWLLEEARMLAADKKLEDAVAFMETLSDCPLKQLDALQWFERSLNLMYLHDYEATSAAFQKCITLNNWSHGLYYYICGAAHVELYRRLKTTNPSEAFKQRERAKALFDKVVPNIGRKKFMARQLPFDVFVSRKVQKWETRAREWNCDFIDAVGVSPIEELIYFWNGYKRMRPEHLAISLQNLAWSESDANPHWAKESVDEKAILALLRAVVYRNHGQTVEAREILEIEIIRHDKQLFKGYLKDNWTAPCARYEMAANLWAEADRDGDGRPERHPELLELCRTWLEEVSRWEAYDLDARIGMKVTTAKATLRRYGIEI